MRLFIIFILFFITEYFLRTFVGAYKDHSVGLFFEFLPLVIVTVLAGLIYKTTILKGHFGWTYLKLVAVSVAALIAVKTLLFIQWYWFIAPEYRNVRGDMAEGLVWTIVDSLVGSFLILVSYLGFFLTVKREQNFREADKREIDSYK